jgi:hypothetical protein
MFFFKASQTYWHSLKMSDFLIRYKSYRLWRVLCVIFGTTYSLALHVHTFNIE